MPYVKIAEEEADWLEHPVLRAYQRQLLSLRRCLLELAALEASGEASQSTDLADDTRHTFSLSKALMPLRLQLSALDSKRTDGKFIISSAPNSDPCDAGRWGYLSPEAIPKGQAVLHALLGECYEILAMLDGCHSSLPRPASRLAALNDMDSVPIQQSLSHDPYSPPNLPIIPLKCPDATAHASINS